MRTYSCDRCRGALRSTTDVAGGAKLFRGDGSTFEVPRVERIDHDPLYVDVRTGRVDLCRGCLVDLGWFLSNVPTQTRASEVLPT